MSSKLITILVIAVVIVAGGIFLLHGNSVTTPSNTSTQNPTAKPTTSGIPMEKTSITPQTSPQAEKNAVTIANFSFSPATLTAKVGDTVTWTNQDNVGHSATADNGTFDTGVLAQGNSGSFTFTKAGTYAYHCSVHPMMHGTIVVQ